MAAPAAPATQQWMARRVEGSLARPPLQAHEEARVGSVVKRRGHDIGDTKRKQEILEILHPRHRVLGEMFAEVVHVSGMALLPEGPARFYSERCYLAQATLGRLLEIYQNKDASKSDSPLTKFVKDLLGLDHLDALIEGLHDAGDVRRLRMGVSLYWEARDRVPKIELEISRQTAQRARLNEEVANVENRLGQRLTDLGLQVANEMALAETRKLLENQSEEPELQRLARLRRDIMAVRDQWQAVQSTVTPQERASAETSMTIANEALEKWCTKTGRELEEVFSTLSIFFADLPSPSSTRPEQARRAALQAVSGELQRCKTLLTRDADDTKRLGSLDQNIGRGHARLGVLEEQITRRAATAGTLAQALAGILPHIHSDDCPVCSRNFSEKSDKPLSAHVSDRIAELTESAGRLEALSRERAEALNALTKAERERGIVAGQQLEPEARNDLKTRRARLEELERSLAAIGPPTEEGERVIATASAASRHLNELRARDQRATTIRETALRFSQDLNLETVRAGESLDSALERFQSHVSGLETLLGARPSARRLAIADVRDVQVLNEKHRSVESAMKEQQQRLDRLRVAKDSADARIVHARELARRAREVRTSIFRRVFNDSLNAIWRDLFVRLAPDEPFVPAFALPETQGGAVEGVLETLYRVGGKGGNPLAMLSAGNLNTAALTLFLALHLAVRPSLPWLVIDDPVQSMDEVHIAQFAALLRTLSKQHGRQVIIAVHEKPLFDYLALELSPALRDDRRITIELGRTANGKTVVKYEPLIWGPDTAVAA